MTIMFYVQASLWNVTMTVRSRLSNVTRISATGPALSATMKVSTRSKQTSTSSLPLYFWFHLHCLEGGITGRGCSTKDKVYYKECETNSYGEGTEKFCYCNFYLCNRGAAGLGHAGQTVLLLSVILVSLHTRYNKHHSSIDARIILHHVDLNDSRCWNNGQSHYMTIIHYTITNSYRHRTD